MKLLSVVTCVLLLIVCINAAAPARKSAAKTSQPAKQTRATKNVNTARNVQHQGAAKGQTKNQSQVRRRDLSFFTTHSFYPSLSVRNNAIPLGAPLAPIAPLPLIHSAPLISPFSAPLPLFPPSINDTIKKLEADLKSYQELQRQTEETLNNLRNGNFSSQFPESKIQPLPDQKLNVNVFGETGHGTINIVNPFIAGKNGNPESANLDPSIADKVNGTAPPLWNGIHTFTGTHGFDPIFGPEIAPKYEIHYVPEGFKFEDFPPVPFLGHGLFPSHPSPFIPPVPSFGVGAPLPPLPNSTPNPTSEPVTTGAPDQQPAGNTEQNLFGNGNPGQSENTNPDSNANGPPPDLRTGSVPSEKPSENGNGNDIGAPPTVDKANPSGEQNPGSQSSGPPTGQSASLVAGSQAGGRAGLGLTRSVVGNSAWFPRFSEFHAVPKRANKRFR